MTKNGRIGLRPKRLSDAKNDYAWQTDPELSRLDAAAVLDMTYQQYISEYTFELCYPSLNRHEFGIDTLEGEHIGNCVYYNVNLTESKAELGIMIGNRKFWNQGFGAEAVTALLSHIFDKTSLERVYLTTLAWNLRAQRCFIKCGFSECGNVVRDDCNFLMMAIHREEFEKFAAAEHENSLR